MRRVNGNWTKSARHGVITIDKTLISYNDLEKDHGSNVNYILNDSLKFRICLILL